MVTLHSKILLSSTKPAEKPSTGFLQRSANEKGKRKKKEKEVSNPLQNGVLNEEIENWIVTFELFLEEKACLIR